MYSKTLLIFYGFLLAEVNSIAVPDDPSCAVGNTKTTKDCCVVPKVVDPVLKARCKAENPLDPNEVKTDGCCVARCSMINLNVFQNNIIDKAAAKRALRATVGADPQFAPITNRIIDACANKVNMDASLRVPPISAATGVEGCSLRPELFIDCVSLQMFQQCPASALTKDAGCDALMAKANSGKCYFETLEG
ncbi:general odorant-binding protein 67-like [Uranotaenia lowii]|uniref:general odorant-binding protein 67-like n=1 Tax=Uranotaenia lowii TaxID=190385 RepID=UPI00247B15A1|nr:general odorant-binding protein 67-like [Uranotaenia lowii]